MSMIGCFIAVSDGDLADVIAEPTRVRTLVGMEAPPKPTGFVARLFGGKRGNEQSAELWRPKNSPKDFDVDKAWQGIHYLLTGSDWEGSGPLAFMLHGGAEIAEEMGYGNPHGFTSAEVKEIAKALEPISSEALFERASQEDFQKKSIYPEIWDEPKEDCIGYVTTYFGELKKFIRETADTNSALIVYLG
jgi:hypothetical protein